MNALVKEATGQETTLQVVNTSTFISAGEQVLATGTENVLNSLSLVLGRTLVAVRPYNAKFNMINAIDTGAYSHRLRKLSFYSRNAQPSGDWNTQLYTNLKGGYTNGQNIVDGTAQSTKSQWEQNPAVVLELNFAGSSTWEDSTTVYEDQLKQAFRDEASFGQFVAGIMTEKANDIESQKEAYNRIVLLNFIAGVIDMESTGSVVNLTYEFNQEFGTNYTSAQLRTTYLKDFLAFMVARIKIDSRMLTNRSLKCHWSPAKVVDEVPHYLLRHTPYDRQRLLLHSPLITKSESYVFPSLFNEEYLKIENYEGVDFWQNEANPASIDVVPAIPNKTTPASGQVAGDEVKIDYLVGVLYDVDAMMTDYQLESSLSTPLEARKRYRNIWWTFSRNGINDFTENAIVYYMADPVEPTPDNDNQD
ncbi:MAG: hypothetical protein IKV80_07085 [Bacteroidales bacterium]|nr:hypothetical protein [Bacteroidales bacterium]